MLTRKIHGIQTAIQPGLLTTRRIRTNIFQLMFELPFLKNFSKSTQEMHSDLLGNVFFVGFNSIFNDTMGHSHITEVFYFYGFVFQPFVLFEEVT